MLFVSRIKGKFTSARAKKGKHFYPLLSEQRLGVEILPTTHKHCFWQNGGGGATRWCRWLRGGSPLRVSRVDFGSLHCPVRLPMIGLIPALRNAVMVTGHIQTQWIDLFSQGILCRWRKNLQNMDWNCYGYVGKWLIKLNKGLLLIYLFIFIFLIKHSHCNLTR